MLSVNKGGYFMNRHNFNIHIKRAYVPTVVKGMIQVIVVVILIAITSCQSASPGHRPPISAAKVKAIATPFIRLSSAYIEAWNTHDTENMRPLLTDDIEYYERSNSYTSKFAGNLISTNELVLSENPSFRGQQAGIFINRGSAFDIWEMWGYSEQGYPSSAEDPITAYDWYTLRDDKIASMWLFWDANFLKAGFNVALHEKPLQDYEDAWSSGDPQTVADLYDPEAVRHDPLFGADQTGPSTIQKFATKFFNWYPGVTFERQKWFQLGESAPVKVGGVYTIHAMDQTGSPCDIQVIILLEAPVLSATSTGKLINEWIFYQPDSLIACGWAK